MSDHKGFIGQSLSGSTPKREQARAGVCDGNKGAWHFYTPATGNVADLYYLWYRLNSVMGGWFFLTLCGFLIGQRRDAFMPVR